MSNLYELTGVFLELLEMMSDEDVDPQILEDTLEGIEYEIELKAEGYAKIIKNMESDIKGLEVEIDRLTKRKKTFQNRIKNLKENLKESMELTGKTKFKTDLFTFRIQKNGGKRKLVVDTDIDDIPTKFKVKQPDIIDRDMLRDYLKDKGYDGKDGGVYCEWCHLEPQSNSLRIS